MSDWIVLQRLLIVTALAGAIGYERERHGRAAGFRTHILVGLGSCLVMLTGLHLHEAMSGQAEFDPTRMAAQVVSGIGFLGAGTILRFRASVRGLTTAASLWAMAGVGLAVGAGFVWGAVMATAIILVTLFGFSRMERAMRKDVYQVLLVETEGTGDDLVEIRRVLSEYDVEIRDLDAKKVEPSGHTVLEFNVKLLNDQDPGELTENLLRLQHTKRAHWA